MTVAVLPLSAFASVLGWTGKIQLGEYYTNSHRTSFTNFCGNLVVSVTEK